MAATSTSPCLPWVALLLLVAAAAATSPLRTTISSLRSHKNSISLRPFGTLDTPRRPLRPSLPSSFTSIEHLRGGASADDADDAEESDYDEDYDDYDEYDEEEEEPIVIKAKKLATSTKSSTVKQTIQRNAATKAKVSAAMAKSSSGGAAVAVKKRSGGSGSLYKRMVPYIVRACLNPFTLFAMTKAYFVSLMDINYLKEEPSQNLRSALEDKARKQPSTGPTKPKRKMKPGQAKTLSDLPQLSA